MLSDLVMLTPRGWIADYQTTGGQIPPHALYIPHSTWKEAGEPKSIEEYYEIKRCRCCCEKRNQNA